MTREQEVGQLPLWWALFNLLLAVIAISVTLWAFVTERGLRVQMAELRGARAQACSRGVLETATPPAVEPEAVAPPQDRPKNGYFGRSGTEITPVMRLKLEALRETGGPTPRTESLRLGSQEVLPSRSIHIINLWATWCEPCRDEMPDFKELFARRADWGKSVRFLPIQLKDPTDPAKAYGELAGIMPPAEVKLADRGLNDPLATALTADEQLKLFHDKLPVTLVLDCNRRVRWAQFDQLTRADFDELEIFVDRFRAELDDTSAGSWCTQVWPGNGRCEGRENTPGHHSFEDCGELKRKPEEVVAPPVEPPPPLVECPGALVRTADGKCVRKLKGEPTTSVPVKPVQPVTCGNGVCDAGEDRGSCCQDCPCVAPMVCKASADDGYRCMVKGLKM